MDCYKHYSTIFWKFKWRIGYGKYSSLAKIKLSIIYWFLLRYTVIIYKFTQGNLGAKKNRQQPISVASREKKLQIATLATDSAIPGLLFNTKWAIFAAISWREQASFQWDDDGSSLVQTNMQLDFYSILLSKTTVRR